MSLLLTGMIGLMSGLLVFLAAPIVGTAIATATGRENPLPEAYFSMAANCFGNVFLVIRETGKMNLELHSGDFDSEMGLWEIKLNGETKHFEDPHDYMSRLYKRPFAIADEKRGVIINPMIAEIGELVEHKHDSGSLVTEIGSETFVDGIIPVRRGAKRLVNLNKGRVCVTGSASASTADRIQTYIEISQSLFDRHPTAQYLIWLMAAGTGFGMNVFAAQYAKSTGGSVGAGSGISVPTIYMGHLVGAIPI